MHNSELIAHIRFFSMEASYCHTGWLKRIWTQELDGLLDSMRTSPALSYALRQRFKLPKSNSWPNSDLDRFLMGASAKTLAQFCYRVGATVYCSQLARLLDRRQVLPLYAAVGKENVKFGLKKGPLIVSADLKPVALDGRLSLADEIRIVGCHFVFSAAAKDSGIQARLRLKISPYLARQVKLNKHHIQIDSKAIDEVVNKVLNQSNHRGGLNSG